MPVQVMAHGFELTESLKQACITETEDKLQPLALHNFSVKWMLSLDASDHVAHVNWHDGKFHGDATVKSHDMYTSIGRVTKTAGEQLKKAHDKRYEHHKADKIIVTEE